MDPNSNKAGELERRVSTRNSVRVSFNDIDDDHDFMVADGFRPTRSEGRTELERRVSTRNSVRVSFSDIDEEHDFMVADGFRPTHSEGRTEPSTPSLTSDSSTLLVDESPGSSSRTGRPSSVSKPYTPRHSLSLRHEQTGLTRHATNSTESTVSTAYFPTDSPYRGPSGPSHPYQMYPQNVRLARTMSVTTSSTLPASESSYTGPRGPSHPYGLYPQSDGIGTETVQAAAIPLGFHGLPDQYQRRVGPDGDDVGDIIGPDGHTEQLPPYTRYPDEAYVPKSRAVDAPPEVPHGGATIVPTALRRPLSTITTVIPGAGGIGLATRNPEFESTEDLESPRSRHSLRSFTSDDSQRRIQLDDENTTEKGKPMKKWQIWMRRKLWGIVPYWAIALTAVVLVVMAAILGSVIGTFMAKQKTQRDGPPSESTFDAIPIATPPDLTPLPLGTFGLPFMRANRMSKTCFQNPALSKAWNCDLVLSSLQLTVSKTADNYGVTLDCNHSYTLSNNVYSYGEQPPLISKPADLQLVRDKFEPSRGPAWFNLLSYNKTVILPEDALSSSSSTSSPQQKPRGAYSMGPGTSTFKRKGIAQQGDKAWICKWPETYLELFIYGQQNSSSPSWSNPMSTTSSSRPPPSSTTPLPNSTPTPNNSASQSYPSSSFPPGGLGGQELDTETEGFRGYWPQNLAHQGNPTGPPSPPSSTETTSSELSSTATPTSPSYPVDTGESFPPMAPFYPRVIKLEERRVSGSPMPRCTQVEIQGPGEEAKVVLDDQGKPIVVDIQESESVVPAGAPTPTADVSRRSARSDRDQTHQLLPRQEVPDISACGCMWYYM